MPPRTLACNSHTPNRPQPPPTSSTTSIVVYPVAIEQASEGDEDHTRQSEFARLFMLRPWVFARDKLVPPQGSSHTACLARAPSDRTPYHHTPLPLTCPIFQRVGGSVCAYAAGNKHLRVHDITLFFSIACALLPTLLLPDTAFSLLLHAAEHHILTHDTFVPDPSTILFPLNQLG